MIDLSFTLGPHRSAMAFSILELILCLIDKLKIADHYVCFPLSRNLHIPNKCQIVRTGMQTMATAFNGSLDREFAIDHGASKTYPQDLKFDRTAL